MPSTEMKSQGTQPPPTGGAVGPRGHPLPRRASPANSVTLRHHRLARDASDQQTNPPRLASNPTSSRRNSSGDSHATGQSDPNKWFDQSNQNPTATFDNYTMDVDPPFFQKETDSSNEGGKSYYQSRMAAPPKLNTAQSSSADEYRSVIDDLTVEIQKLKDELKRHKQKGPDMLRKDKLFEIKIHGLPKRKKRELESTLRDFTSGLERSPDTSSSRKNQASPKGNSRDHMYSNSGSMSKHASSSTGSNARPADSAYASMSIGANSSGASLVRPSISSRTKSSEQKVESYLRDIPEGLYPHNTLLTDKEKKKLIVRRLEQLFTGKISGRSLRKPQQQQQSQDINAAVMGEGQMKQQYPLVHQPPTLETRATTTSANREPSREARIIPLEQSSGKKSRSRDNGSASNSGGDQTESGGAHGGANTSPPGASLPEQRPTRVKDLDPDRPQVPSENMEYIKHLGLVPPELLNQPTEDVHPDADGWVYLNLLCSLAQLHMINVTPDFVRTAVSGISTKFQLSPDGRKIRWRGGTEGTRFSSDSSGDNSQNNSPDCDVEHVSSSKRQKTGHSTGDEFQSGGSSSKHASKFGSGAHESSETFHYKPLFVHQISTPEQTSMDETLSSFGPVEDSNIEDSRWGNSGSGNTSGRKKRRRDGAIIYYSGAPFCTDLSGDPGDSSPMTYMTSSAQEPEAVFARPCALRTPSGSSLSYRPLAQKNLFDEPSSKMDVDSIDPPGLTADSGNETDDDIDLELDWSQQQQYIDVHPLEPCGLGGVMPDDHFMVVVTTKRPKEESSAAPQKSRAEATTDNIISRLASMTTSSPGPLNSTASSRSNSPGLEIEYTSGRIKRLNPVRLPPPAIFCPPFSDGSSSDEEALGSEGDDELESEQPTSRLANGHRSDGYPDNVDLSSGDEDGEDPNDEPDTQGMYEGEERPRSMPARRQSSVAGRTDRSSVATAGGMGSVGSVGSSVEISP